MSKPVSAPPPTSTTAEVWGELVRIAWPIVTLNVLNVLALAVDTAMCGQLPDAETALTGLGFATQVSFLLMVAMIGLTVGTVAMVARGYGAGDLQRVLHVLEQSTLLTLGLAAIVATLGNLVAGPVLLLLGADEASLGAALAYLRPLLTFTVFPYLTLLYGAVLRGVGDTRTPLMVALLTNGLNVCLNYLLILGHLGAPALGVQGAAIGTVIAQGAGAFTLAWLHGHGAIEGVKLAPRLPTLDPPLARQLIRVGLPAAADAVVLNGSFLSIIGMLGRIDPLAVGAHGLGLRIQALAFVPGMSIGQATGVLVGQHLGAADPLGARRIVKASVLLCTGVMTALAVAIVANHGPIVGLFGVDPSGTLGTYATTWIDLLGYGLPVAGVFVALQGMLQGAGDTRASLRINLITTVLFQVPLSWALGFPMAWGAFGVWVAFPLSFVLKSLMAWAAYLRGDWARTGKDA